MNWSFGRSSYALPQTQIERATQAGTTKWLKKQQIVTTQRAHMWYRRARLGREQYIGDWERAIEAGFGRIKNDSQLREAQQKFMGEIRKWAEGVLAEVVDLNEAANGDSSEYSEATIDHFQSF